MPFRVLYDMYSWRTLADVCVVSVVYYAQSLAAVYYGKYRSVVVGYTLQAHSSKVPTIVPYPDVLQMPYSAAYYIRATVVLW